LALTTMLVITILALGTTFIGVAMINVGSKEAHRG